MSFVVLFVECFLLNFNVATYVETLDSLIIERLMEVSSVKVPLRSC